MSDPTPEERAGMTPNQAPLPPLDTQAEYLEHLASLRGWTPGKMRRWLAENMPGMVPRRCDPATCDSPSICRGWQLVDPDLEG